MPDVSPVQKRCSLKTTLKIEDHYLSVECETTHQCKPRESEVGLAKRLRESTARDVVAALNTLYSKIQKEYEL